MKNIIARGGVEFIAVLLGISGSLWIDNNKDLKELNYQIERSLHALSETLKSDKKVLEKYINIDYKKKIIHFEYIQNDDSVKYSSDSRLRKAFENTTTNAGIRLDNTIFNSLESLGLIYKIDDDSLRNGILNLYQKKYVFLKEITDYHLHTIQQMDEVVLENFVMSKETTMWNLKSLWLGKSLHSLTYTLMTMAS